MEKNTKDILTIATDQPEFEPIQQAIYQTQQLCFQLNSQFIKSEKVNNIISKIIGKKVSDTFSLLPPFYCDYGKNIEFGEYVFINMNCTMMDLGGITLEDNVMFGPNCQIITENHGTLPSERHILQNQPVIIKKNAWLGAGVTVLPGVTIGENSIIGAGSVVTKSVPDNCIAAGIPAKVIKRLQ